MAHDAALLAPEDPSSAGVAWYIGVPKAGKTWLAIEHALTCADATGWPIVLLDPAGDAQMDELQGFTRVSSAREVIKAVWGRGESVVWTIEDPADAEPVFAAAQLRGRVVLLLDEAYLWLTARSCSSRVLTLIRQHRHAHVRLLMTAHHITADVPAAALSCAPDLYVFRCIAPAVLKRLRELGIDDDAVRHLAQRRCVHHRTGW